MGSSSFSSQPKCAPISATIAIASSISFSSLGSTLESSIAFLLDSLFLFASSHIEGENLPSSYTNLKVHLLKMMRKQKQKDKNYQIL